MSSKTMFKLCCIVLIVTLLFESSLGQTCVIDGVDEADWASSKNVNFEDAARDEVFSASTTNVAGISSYSQTGNLNFKSDYITPSYQGGVFTLTLTDAFADYEKQETLREFNLVVVFSCASQSRTLTIICRITDRNTYPPEFLPSNSYQYEIFTPMPPGVPISKLYGPISVVDYDLTTSSIDFTIEPNDYLEIVYDSVDSSKKIHTAILMTKSAILTIEGQREIKIFATDKDDTNDPPFTSEATITLTSNPVAQLPSAPQFSKPYFTGTIKDGLLTIDDQIEITSGYDDEIQFSLSDDKYFQVANTEKVVTITLKAPIPDEILENTDHFLFSVHAALQNTAGGSATVYVSIPKDDSVLKFEQSTYTGTYSDNELKIEDIILDGYNTKVDVKLTGDYEEFFDIEIVGTNSVRIKKVKDLTAEIIDSTSRLLLLLEATTTGKFSSTTVVIDLPKVPDTILKFEELYYTGTYSYDDAQLTPLQVTLTEGYSESVHFELSGDGREYFTISPEDNKVTVTGGNLPESLLEAGSLLLLTLSAAGPGSISTATTLAITLVAPIDYPIQFVEVVQRGSYSFKDKELILLPIFLADGFPTDVTYELTGENNRYFALKPSDNNVEIVKQADIPEELAETLYITLVLQALSEHSSSIGQTVVTIALLDGPSEQTKILKFEQANYKGNYLEDNKLELPAIKLTEMFDLVKYVLTGDYSDNFEITSQDSTMIIEVMTELSDEILNSYTHIVLVVEAQVTGAVSGQTSIVIDLPNKDGVKVLKFEQANYKGNYLDNDQLELPVIKLTEVFDVVKYVLTGDFSDNFEITSQDSTVIFAVKAPLSVEILNTYTHIVLVVEAQVTGAVSGQTSIVIDLPIKEEGVQRKILKFKQANYKGNYLDNDILDLPVIELTEVFDVVKYVLTGDFSDNFEITSQSSTVTFEVKNPLSDETLDTFTHIVLVVEAQVTDAASGQTSIVIDLPIRDGVQRKVLKFEQANYKGNYLDNDKLELPVIKLTEMFDVVKYVLTGDFSENFEITSQDSTVIFAVKAPLSVETLNTYTHIVLVVEAQVTDALSGQTSIVIDLPIKDGGVQRKILKFEKANYKGNYLDDNKLDLPAIKLTEVFDVVNYVLTGDFSDNFEITSMDSTLTFEVKTSLSDETLNTYTHIILVVEAQVTDTDNGLTSIVLDLPIKEDGIQRKVLKFEQANYQGNYLETNKLDLPSIKLTELYDVVSYVLSGDFSKNFDITSRDSTVTIEVITPLSDETLSTFTHIVLVVEAQVTDAVNGQTSIVVDLPLKDGTGVILQFEDPYYEVQYKDNHEIDVPAIKLTKEYDSVDFTLSGEFKDHFSVTSTGESTAVLAVIIHLPAEVLEEKSFLVLVLEASLTEAVGAKATINIALPIKDITIAVSFDETFYSGLYAYSTNTLTIPAITLVEGYNDNTDFSLSGENSELFETDSDGNTVTLKIKGNLPESLLDVTSVLLFSIQAVRPGAPLATAVIAISLRAKAGIPGNALTIIDILEQKSYQNMNIGDIEDNCKYVKKSTWPESTPDWFEVDSTGKFLNIKEISREDPSVAFLYLSQAQLELSIDCSTSIRRNATKENDDADDAERYWISTKSINYSPDKRMVTVIIRDINNNPPVFDTANPLIIGFPIQDIAYVIRPQALYTVHATDKDIGINAEIKYTTDNDYFSVHPETGVIYPKHDLYTENALTETINFKVSATDGEDESGSTHTVDLNIMVKPLKQSDISIITIEDAVIEDIPEIISTLSDKLNSKVHMLTSAVLPSTNHLRSQNNNHMDKFLRSKRDFSGEDTSLAMFIYALDNQNEIISGSELVSKIEGIVDVGNLDWTVTSIPLSESSLMGGLGKTSSNTGLIAATAVLGSLLFITLVGIVVFYFLVVRKKYRTFSNSHSSGSDVSSIQSEEDKKSNLDYVDEVGTSQLDNLTLTKGDVIIPGFARELDNENQGQIKGTNSSDVDEDEYGEPSSKGRRKSMVTFNEKVLQIDIDPSYEDERL